MPQTVPGGNPQVGGSQTSATFPGFTAYTGAAATPSGGSIVSDGYNGTIMWELWEDNVAGGGAVLLEGSYDNTTFYAMGYYTVVSNGTTQTSLTRAQGAITLAQSGRYVLQCLDAYPYQRARVTANGSSASLNARAYLLPF